MNDDKSLLENIKEFISVKSDEANDTSSDKESHFKLPKD